MYCTKRLVLCRWIRCALLATQQQKRPVVLEQPASNNSLSIWQKPKRSPWTLASSFSGQTNNSTFLHVSWLWLWNFFVISFIIHSCLAMFVAVCSAGQAQSGQAKVIECVSQNLLPRRLLLWLAYITWCGWCWWLPVVDNNENHLARVHKLHLVTLSLHNNSIIFVFFCIRVQKTISA